MMIFLLLLPLFFLLSAPNGAAVLISAAVYLLSGILITHFSHKEKISLSISYPMLSSAISLSLGGLFYLRWQNAALFAAMESLPKMPAKRICGIAAAVLAVLSLWGTDVIVSTLHKLILKKEPAGRRICAPAYLGLTSVVIITLISKCSPFYAFNDWVDAHTMFSVGKAILNGLIPYKEVFEQKGPLLLFLHSVAAFISFENFTGVWLLEIVSCFFFLLFSWRILKLTHGEKALPLMPLLALLVFSALSFEQGDSAEEFCLPLMTYGMLVGYRTLRAGELPSRRDWILIGVTSGCILWIKYSMLGFYLGWFLAVYLFARSQGNRRDVFLGLVWITAGVAAVSLPILIWFAVRGGLAELFNVYFYENMFLYPNTADLRGNFALHRNLANGLLNFIFFSTVIFIASVLGLVRTAKNETKPVFRFVLYTFIGLFLVVYFSGRFYTYYSLIFGVFALFGLGWAVDIAEKIFRDRRSLQPSRGTIDALALCLSVLGTFFFSGNMRSLAFEKTDYPQYQAKAVIEASGIENPTLLNYGFLDMGVNQIAGLMPSQRFFCSFNLPLEDIEKEQNACLVSGCTDFVLTFMLEIDSPEYEPVGKFPANYRFWKIQPSYNLYQKIPLQESGAEE